MLVCQREDWQHGFRQVDPKNPHYFDRAGNPTTCEALLAIAPDDAEAMVTPERMGERYDQAEAAMDELRERIRAARLDVLLVVGDDQTGAVPYHQRPGLRDLLRRHHPQREARGKARPTAGTRRRAWRARNPTPTATIRSTPTWAAG
ncbi:hypothetical protein ACTMU2_18760 [Cupriavidus basilensis]